MIQPSSSHLHFSAVKDSLELSISYSVSSSVTTSVTLVLLGCRYITNPRFSLLGLQENNYYMKSYLLIGAVGFKVAEKKKRKLVRVSIA